MICAASPHPFNIEETLSTLKFGQRAKKIKNPVKINAQKSVGQLMKMVEVLRKTLKHYKAYSKNLETQIGMLQAGEDITDIVESIERPDDIDSKKSKKKKEESNGSVRNGNNSTLKKSESSNSVADNNDDDEGDDDDEEFKGSAKLMMELSKKEEEFAKERNKLQDEIEDAVQQRNNIDVDLTELRQKHLETEEDLDMALQDAQEIEDRLNDKSIHLLLRILTEFKFAVVSTYFNII